MHIKLTRDALVGLVTFAAGSVAEVPNDRAKTLIARGHAVPVTQADIERTTSPAPAIEQTDQRQPQAEQTTAGADAPETTDAPTPEKPEAKPAGKPAGKGKR
jgi:hypothetical protein